MDRSAGGHSRRQVLSAGVAAVAMPGLRRAALPWLRGAPSTPQQAADDWRLARFAPHVGSAFVVRQGGQATRLTLAEATARPPHRVDRAGLTGESFSLIFRGDRSAAIPGGVHTVVHPALGTMSLALLCVDRGVVGRTYQAVVDRRAPAR